jgi:hypothetical protein
MSQQKDLTAIQLRLDELIERVGQLERTIDKLRGADPVTRAEPKPAPGRPELVTIPDTPYNNALWTDSDDEGLGVRDRHAP